MPGIIRIADGDLWKCPKALFQMLGDFARKVPSANQRVQTALLYGVDSGLYFLDVSDWAGGERCALAEIVEAFEREILGNGNQKYLDPTVIPEDAKLLRKLASGLILSPRGPS